MGAKLILRSLAVAVGAMALNVACAFLWVAIYAYLIAPGQSEAAYQDYAMRAVPWSSVIAGVPILMGAGWLLARWHGGGWKTGIWAAVLYVVVDLAIQLAAGALGAMPGIVALSQVTKLVASAFGGAMAGKR
ncbi:MAG: hypothetical protein ACXWUP_14200 [Allosphingosinicella sp.]